MVPFFATHNVPFPPEWISLCVQAIMQTSTSVVFYGFDQPLKLIDIPIPALRSGEILVRNEYATLCRSDLHTFCGNRTEKIPTILGHEVVGRIADFGPHAVRTDLLGRPLANGSRLSWAIYAADPQSDMSRKGIPQKSADLFKYGHERLAADHVLHGGLSQFTILRQHTPIMCIDEAVPAPVAALVNCAVATVAGAVRLAGTIDGRRVLVSGAGMLGMVACAMCKTMGAKHICAMDVHPARLATATTFGADSTRLPMPHQPGDFDVVLECSGQPDAMEQTLRLLAIGGTAVWVGATYPTRALNLSAEQLVRNLWTIKGLHNYNANDFVAAVLFIEAHWNNFPFLSLVHDAFTLQMAQQAFEYGVQMNPFRVGLRID